MIHFNIIPSSTSRSSKPFLSSRFSYKILACFSLLSRVCYLPIHLIHLDCESYVYTVCVLILSVIKHSKTNKSQQNVHITMLRCDWIFVSWTFLRRSCYLINCGDSFRCFSHMYLCYGS